jgi:hypothetical protein
MRATYATGLSPLWEHDCDSCTYLGQEILTIGDGDDVKRRFIDWYYHVYPYGVGLVGRNSNEPSEYTSTTIGHDGGWLTRNLTDGFQWAIQRTLIALAKVPALVEPPDENGETP